MPGRRRRSFCHPASRPFPAKLELARVGPQHPGCCSDGDMTLFLVYLSAKAFRVGPRLSSEPLGNSRASSLGLPLVSLFELLGQSVDQRLSWPTASVRKRHVLVCNQLVGVTLRPTTSTGPHQAVTERPFRSIFQTFQLRPLRLLGARPVKNRTFIIVLLVSKLARQWELSKTTSLSFEAE